MMTLLSLFQTMLKEKEVVENIQTKVILESHPEELVDLEVTKIANEKLTTFDGLDDAETIPGTSTDVADRAVETEV
jgi:hypothetical protein